METKKFRCIVRGDKLAIGDEVLDFGGLLGTIAELIPATDKEGDKTLLITVETANGCCAHSWKDVRVAC